MTFCFSSSELNYALSEAVRHILYTGIFLQRINELLGNFLMIPILIYHVKICVLVQHCIFFGDFASTSNPDLY